jgi:hypothetical protein
MKVMNFLKRMLGRGAEPVASPTQQLLNMLAMTDPQEISCEHIFAVLDQYAEAIHHDQDAERLWPLVKKHLDMCPDCCEEYEGLVAMLQVAG